MKFRLFEPQTGVLSTPEITPFSTVCSSEFNLFLLLVNKEQPCSRTEEIISKAEGIVFGDVPVFVIYL